MRRVVLAACVLLLVLPLAALAAHSDEDKELKDWSFTFTPYFWLSNSRTDVDGEIIRANVDQTAGLTESAFMFIASVSWKRWTVATDGLFSTIGTEQVAGPLDLDVKVKQTIFTPKLGFKILDSRRQGQDGGTALWANLGARYWQTEPTIDYTWNPIIGDDPISDTFALDDNWWDPFIGASAHFKVTRVVHFFAKGSVGGFGLGEASDFTWDLGSYASFRIWKYAAVHAGYQILYYDRTAGDGDAQVTTKQHMSGLFFGVSFFY